jgi:hypothetical protein
MAGSLLKNLKMFNSICGQQAMPNVVIATTMWGEVKQENGVRREQERKEEYWKDMVANGCRVERFKDTHESAWHVIGNNGGAKIQLSHELVELRLWLQQTTAGITLNNELQKLAKAQREHARKLRAQAKNENALVVEQLNQQLAEFDHKIAKTADELEKLKIPLAAQMPSLFKY